MGSIINIKSNESKNYKLKLCFDNELFKETTS